MEMAGRFVENGVDSKYSIGEEIARGAFGVVMQGIDRDTSEIVDNTKRVSQDLQHIQFQVAIKFEKFDAKTGSFTSNLDTEITAYKRLDGVEGIPKVISYGKNFLAMERLGPSMTDIQRKKGYKPFELRSILLIAKQLVTRIESIHSRGISHRDIKMDNILFGLGPLANLLYIIDFGLSIADGTNDCQRIFRKIDLREAGLAIKSLYQGSIGVVTPAEIGKYMDYCNNLNDGDVIDYKYLKKLFSETFRLNGFTGSIIFD